MLAELKKHYAEWETNLEKATAKKAELEKFVEDFSIELYEKFKGALSDLMLSHDYSETSNRRFSSSVFC